MSRFHLSLMAGLLAGMSWLTSASLAEAATGPLQRTNAGSRLYMVTPAMMHAIDVIVAEKMKMVRRRR